ncbi:unnamed protein product [Mytilus edulis]|uniref:C-type lectin domain-containing protein n=1 Tax=Mytilus edulis TaxID=6550 RepID=A0A8S3RYH1_MYTED|nr:unnamed protein product [Mytilus edulis]
MPESQRRAFQRVRSASAGMVEDIFFKWQQAKLACERKGAHLAEIESEAENNFVKQLAQKVPNHSIWLGGNDKLKKKLGSGQDLGNHSFSQIGGNDIAHEGTWVWAGSGKPLTFTDWWKSTDGRRKDEPDNKGRSGSDCLSLSKYDNYSAWHDSECSLKRRRGDFKGIICEKRKL